MTLGEFPIKREGSQGQNKTYLIALKLAQFDFLRRTGKPYHSFIVAGRYFRQVGCRPRGADCQIGFRRTVRANLRDGYQS